jgi:general secretion pathway protein J
MPRINHRKGFTLLEILVALFIFSIIAVIMTHALHIIFDSQSVTEKHSAQLAQLELATLFMEHDFEQALDRPITNAQGNPEQGLLGKSDSVSFTHGGLSNPAGELTRSTLQRTSYILEKEHLVRASWEVLDQVNASEASKRQLLDKISKLQFEYLDEQGHYNDRWPPPNKPKTEALPYAVKITFYVAKWGEFSQVYVIPGRDFGKKTA